MSCFQLKKARRLASNPDNNKHEIFFFKQVVVIINCITMLNNKLYYRNHSYKVQNNLSYSFKLFIHLQSCISGLTMIILAIVFNIGQQLLTNKWALFAVTTIGWEIAHVLDGSEVFYNLPKLPWR